MVKAESKKFETRTLLRNFYFSLFRLIGILTLIVLAPQARSQQIIDFESARIEIDLRRQAEITQLIHAKHASVLQHHGQRTQKSVLIVHGLFESPHYMKGLRDFFFSQNMNVLSLLLSHHWRLNDPLMKKTDFRSWLRDLEWGFRMARNLGEKVILVGYSTGGILAYETALSEGERGQDIEALITFSPALAIKVAPGIAANLGRWMDIYPGQDCNPTSLTGLCFLFDSINRMFSDSLKEGIPLSPDAAEAVKTLIQRNFSEELRKSGHAGDHLTADKYMILRNRYGRLKIPWMLILPSNDNLIPKNYLKAIFRDVRARKYLKEYGPRDTIEHTNISKYAQDAFQSRPEHFNPYMRELEEEMKYFLCMEVCK